MTDYPNIEALAQGTVSGRVSEWPALKHESRAILDELEALRSQVIPENQETGGGEPVAAGQRPADWNSQIERAIKRAEVFDDGSDGADAESARSVVAILRGVLETHRDGPGQDKADL